MKRLFLLLPFAAAFSAGCSPFPQGLDTHGNAPLIVDLDAESPIVVGEENGATVRGPDKGDGERGGITGTFLGNGGPMCIVIDPENNYNGSNHLDDGDMDLFAGRAADYTGTPGVKMGAFEGEYVDPLGVSHPLDQNLCVQFDRFGLPGAHAGVAAAEFCDFETDAGVPYLLHGETFSVPPDDQMLTVALVVLNGACSTYAPDEGLLDGDAGN